MFLVTNEIVTVCEKTIYLWFNSNFSDTTISPYLTDYCDTCFILTEAIKKYSIQANLYGQQNNNEKKVECEILSNNVTRHLDLHRDIVSF